MNTLTLKFTREQWLTSFGVVLQTITGQLYFIEVHGAQDGTLIVKSKAAGIVRPATPRQLRAMANRINKNVRPIITPCFSARVLKRYPKITNLIDLPINWDSSTIGEIDPANFMITFYPEQMILPGIEL